MAYKKWKELDACGKIAVAFATPFAFVWIFLKNCGVAINEVAKWWMD